MARCGLIVKRMMKIVSEFDDFIARDLEYRKDHAKTVVRLKTSYWRSDRGLHQRRDLFYLKRKSSKYNLIDDDAVNAGADLAIQSIVNFEDCDDGVYQLVMVNAQRDFESGYVDSWEHKLVKIEDAEKI